MSGEMKVGFSMHPRWLGAGGLDEFLRPLCPAGLSALEFELDERQPDWLAFAPLMEEAAERGIDLSFHAPYRARYSLQGFAGPRRDEIAGQYAPALAVADRWGERLGGSRAVVIHAAAGREPADRESLVADTLAFFDWALERFPNLCFMLENNAPAKEGEVKAGDTLAGVLALLQQIDNPHARACWDLGHDYLVRGASAPPAAWLEAVAHVHVHDVDERGMDHFPLIFQRVPCREWLGLLAGRGAAGIAVLELKGGQLKGWPLEKITAALVQSLSWIAEVVNHESSL